MIWKNKLNRNEFIFNKKIMDTQLKEYTKVKTGNFVVPLQDACENKGKYTEAYPIGFTWLETAMTAKGQKKGGVRAGDLMVLTGMSGNGKTMLALNITKSMSEHFGCLWFSYEIIMDNLYAKFKEMGVDLEKKDNLIFAPKKNISGNLKWIKEKIEEAMEKYNINMVFIDHIDFLSPSKEKNDPRRIIIRDICQELKDIATELKITIFLIAHIKKVQGREVEMQDLSESGGLYQIPDYVLAISRGFDRKTVNGRDLTVPTNEGVIKFLKNRFLGEFPYMQFKVENNIIKPSI